MENFFLGAVGFVLFGAIVVIFTVFGYNVSASSMIDSCTKTGVYITKESVIKCEVKK